MIAAATIGFALIVTLWWIYFVYLAEAGEHSFGHAADHTRLARAGLAFAHGVMVCGAIVVAVAIELIVAHPHEAIHAPTAVIAFAGPTIFLLGSAMFHRTMASKLPLSYLIAALALAAWSALALTLHLNGLWLGAGVLAVMMLVAAFAHRKGHAA